MTIYLSERLAGRHNNLNLMRLFAAFLVLFGHSYTLVIATVKAPHRMDPISEPLRFYMPFQSGFPGIGVSLFFFISGLLVARSFLNRPRAGSFLLARILRLYPALIFNLLFTIFVIGWICTTLPTAEYFGTKDTWRYFNFNFSLLRSIRYTLPGTFDDFIHYVVNGSLWTLPYELRLYGWVLALGLLGILRKRAVWLALFAGLLIWSQFYLPPLPVVGTECPERLWIMFFLGITACLYADKIPLHPVLLLGFIASAALAWHLWQPAYNALATLTFCYAVLMLAYRRYWRRLDIGRIGDFSYGVYLYAFPVQQALLYVTNRSLTPLELFAASSALTLTLAALSWFAVERPALALKSYFGNKDARLKTLPARQIAG